LPRLLALQKSEVTPFYPALLSFPIFACWQWSWPSLSVSRPRPVEAGEVHGSDNRAREVKSKMAACGSIGAMTP
jgi:hypothetical protein